ncbi:hypothetical protein GCM10009107_40580 [Ideonella azotifigens]|uniref:Glycoside hydrolase family 5 domain-containing protein n=1 Tax=Ideonella azotifigens TaxID=513160 RepID=A0ABP3VHB0_9BURK
MVVGLICASTALAAPTGQVSVRDGRELLRDCRPWVPSGLNFYGRVIPAKWNSDPDTLAAQSSFGAANMEMVTRIAGDSVRYAVGMPFLDPQSRQYQPDYQDELAAAVKLARDRGLTVFLLMQWQGRTKVHAVETMPGPSSLRAWQALAPRFSDDLGVVFELFNEPQSVTRPDSVEWERWRQGHQAIIDALRAQGAQNVVLVDGMNGGRRLSGAPELKDPLRQVIYGVHPYIRADMNSVPEWDDYFGRFADDHVVVATEWSHFARMCEVAPVGVVRTLLGYLEHRRIGVLAYGAESQDSRLFKKTSNGRFDLTSFDGVSCTSPDAGPGEDLAKMFGRLSQSWAHTAPVSASACGLSPAHKAER